MQFEIRAIKHPQSVTVFALDAVDEMQARQQAAAQGYAVLAVKTKVAWLKRREHFPLLLFSQQLVALLDAGVALDEALKALSKMQQSGDLQTVLNQVLEHLYQGHTLSAALERCPAVFPPLYVASVRASEKTGDLGQALSRYVAYRAQVEVLRSKLVTASIYPALLMLVGGTVTLFLLGYVVPKFTAIYADLGREQPLPLRLLMQFGGVLNQHGGALAIFLLCIIAAFSYVLTNSGVRERLLSSLHRIPALTERVKWLPLAPFCPTARRRLWGCSPASS